MITTNIYILIDPENQQVRYVGKANNVSQRYKAHLNRARKHQIHKLNWINSLKIKGLKPILEVVDNVPIEEWHFWETYWISQFRTWGFRLINYTNGGDGSTFGNQTTFKKGNVSFNDTNTHITCENCNKEFKISPNKLGKKKFCSKECYSKSKTGISFINNGSFKSNHNPWNKGLKGYTTSKKGKPLQKEVKEKISNTLRGKPSKKKRNIKQLDMNRNLIKEFSSITEAKIQTGIKGIGNVLTRRAKTAGGYLWE